MEEEQEYFEPSENYHFLTPLENKLVDISYSYLVDICEFLGFENFLVHRFQEEVDIENYDPSVSTDSEEKYYTQLGMIAEVMSFLFTKAANIVLTKHTENLNDIEIDPYSAQHPDWAKEIRTAADISSVTIWKDNKCTHRQMTYDERSYMVNCNSDIFKDEILAEINEQLHEFIDVSELEVDLESFLTNQLEVMVGELEEIFYPIDESEETYGTDDLGDYLEEAEIFLSTLSPRNWVSKSVSSVIHFIYSLKYTNLADNIWIKNDFAVRINNLLVELYSPNEKDESYTNPEEEVDSEPDDDDESDEFPIFYPN
jgi:hypothetical protein